MYFCKKFDVRFFNLCTLVCAHTRIPNHKDTNCLRNNNRFCPFFHFKEKSFMATTTKREIRKAVRSEIARLSPEQKCALSAQIFSKIATLEEFTDARVVALFVSLADEPVTPPFIEQIGGSKRVVVPRIEGEEMEFYDIAEGLKEGAYGILEPCGEVPVEPSEIDVMIVPGVAFTADGARCGRGKGFYDKYLSRNGFRACTIGVCYPCQVVKELPTEEHDKRLDCVISI